MWKANDWGSRLGSCLTFQLCGLVMLNNCSVLISKTEIIAISYQHCCRDIRHDWNMEVLSNFQVQDRLWVCGLNFWIVLIHLSIFDNSISSRGKVGFISNRKSKSNYLKQQISLAHIAEKSKLSWIHFIFSVILLDFPLLMVRRGEL